MRYYIYLDRTFLRTLFAVLDDFDFNIDIIEYAVRKSYTSNNDVSIDPSVENGKSCDTFKEIEKSKNSLKKNNFTNERIRVGFDKGVTYNVQTERKYINVSDMTDMKNISFYHKLVLNVEKFNKEKRDRRIYIEEGKIITYDENIQNTNINQTDGFFRINNTCIWYDKKNIQLDILMLSKMNCKVKVVGYVINTCEKENIVIKALAIYIE